MKYFKGIMGNAILIFLLIGVYFLIMEATGLADKAFLRTFNFVFIFYGVNHVIKQRIEEGKTGYVGNFGAGILTSFIGVFISIIALGLYIQFFKGAEYMQELASSILIADGPSSIAQYCIALMIEGLASSVVLSFILMQYWKGVRLPEHA